MCVLLLALSCLLPLMVHPIMLGILILCISSICSVILSSIVISWFGYSLFLVYVGGVLVMFSYVVALSPNIGGVNYNYFSGLFLVLIFFNFIITWYLDFNLLWSFKSEFSSFCSSFFLISGLFSNKNISVMALLLIMLLFTMVMIVKICYYRSGPLRPFS